MTITEIPQPAAWEDYYTDPHPGMKGSDRITEACGACAGTGLYTAPTWITDSTGRPYCFRSARATARAHAKARAEHVDQVRSITARRAEFEVAHPGLRDRLTEAHIALRDGNQLWGTRPAAISSAARGDIVEFTATISASDDDESFGFFARPTKAHVIAASICRSA